MEVNKAALSFPLPFPVRNLPHLAPAREARNAVIHHGTCAKYLKFEKVMQAQGARAHGRRPLWPFVKFRTEP